MKLKNKILSLLFVITLMMALFVPASITNAVDDVDLTVTNVGASSSTIYDADKIKFNAIIRNLGSKNLTDDFTVNFYVNGIIFESVDCTNDVNSNGMTVVQTEKEYSTYFGTHKVTASVNFDKEIEESDYSNNSLKSRFVVIDEVIIDDDPKFSIAELAKDIEFNGEKISLPCKVADLKEKFVDGRTATEYPNDPHPTFTAEDDKSCYSPFYLGENDFYVTVRPYDTTIPWEQNKVISVEVITDSVNKVKFDGMELSANTTLQQIQDKYKNQNLQEYTENNSATNFGQLKMYVLFDDPSYTFENGQYTGYVAFKFDQNDKLTYFKVQVPYQKPVKNDSYVEDGVLNIEKVLKEGITLNGKKISLPCTVADLGDEWYIDESEHKIKTKSEVEEEVNNIAQYDPAAAQKLMMNRKCPSGYISNGDIKVPVYFAELSDTGYDDILICGMNTDSSKIDVCDLLLKENPLEEMKKIFGEPRAIFGGSINGKPAQTFQYYNDDTPSLFSRIQIGMTDDGKTVETIQIIHVPEEKTAIDIKKVLDEGLTIDGKKISLPFKVKDLGDDWYIYTTNIKTKDQYEQEYNSAFETGGQGMADTYAKAYKTPSASITNGKIAVHVNFCEYSNSGYEDIPICGINGETEKCKIDVFGLAEKEDALREMKELFGKPFRKTSDAGTVVMYKYGKEETIDNEYMQIYIKNGKVESYNIMYLPEVETIDIKKTLDDGLTIDGKKISLPFTVKDLGDDWQINPESNIMTKDEFDSAYNSFLEQEGKETADMYVSMHKRPTGSITNGELKITVEFCEYSNSGYEDVPICSILGYPEQSKIDVFGLAENEDVLSEMKILFGKPYRSTDENGATTVMYKYGKEETINDEFIQIYIKDGKVDKYYIVYVPEEYR